MARKTKLRALLVGVTQYVEPPEPAMVTDEFESQLPSAALDVAMMMELVEELQQGFDYTDVSVLPLVGADLTERSDILEGLQWLGEADGDTQLLFYFSGHGKLVLSGTLLKEVLLPSDYDWEAATPVCINDGEMLSRLRPALERGACLEVVIEACSATHKLGKVKGVSLDSFKVKQFGCFFGDRRFPAVGAVWAACLQQQQSHSGHVPDPCGDGPVQGVFTYFFCRHFRESALNRAVLLDQITKDVAHYQSAYNACCPKEKPMGLQTPCLYLGGGAFTEAPKVKGLKLGAALAGACESPGFDFDPAPGPCSAPTTSLRPAGPRGPSTAGGRLRRPGRP